MKLNQFFRKTHLQHLLPADMFWNSTITRMAVRCVLSGLTHYNFIQSVRVFNCLLLLFFMQETQPETSELKQLCLACVLPNENRAYKLQWNLPFTYTVNNLPQSTCTGRIKGLGHCSEEPSAQNNFEGKKIFSKIQSGYWVTTIGFKYACYSPIVHKLLLSTSLNIRVIICVWH